MLSILRWYRSGSRMRWSVLGFGVALLGLGIFWLPGPSSVSHASDPTCGDYGFYPGDQLDQCNNNCSEACKIKRNCQGGPCPGGYCWACAVAPTPNPGPTDTPPGPPPPCTLRPNFTATPTSLAEGGSVTFTVTTPPNAIAPYAWDFGDTQHSNNNRSVSVVHQYNHCGIFNAVLTAGVAGCSGGQVSLATTINVDGASCGGEGAGGGEHR